MVNLDDFDVLPPVLPVVLPVCYPCVTRVTRGAGRSHTDRDTDPIADDP